MRWILNHLQRPLDLFTAFLQFDCAQSSSNPSVFELVLRSREEFRALRAPGAAVPTDYVLLILRIIHENYGGLPIGTSVAKEGGLNRRWLIAFLEGLAQSAQLSTEHVDALAPMLLWPELRCRENCCPRISILRAISRHPRAVLQPILSAHLSWLEGEIAQQNKQTDYRRDLTREREELRALMGRKTRRVP